MADPKAVFGIEVDTGASFERTEKLAKELNDLRDEIGADKKELTAMSQALKAMSVDTAKYKDEIGSLRAL